MPSFTKVANGTIRPSRFVKLDTTADGLVLECDAGDQVYGISGPGTRNTPLDGLDDGNHAIAGENCLIYGPPEKEVLLEIGTGGCSPGDRLASDADGKGVVATADEYGAIASVMGVEGEVIPVQCVPPAVSP